MANISAVSDEYRSSLLVATLFGLAIAINHGRWSYGAFAVLVVAFALVAWGFFMALRRRTRPPSDKPSWTVAVVLAVLGTMPVTALLDATVIPEHAARAWIIGRGAQVASLLLLATYIPFLGAKRESDLVRNVRFALFGVLVCVAGVSAIRLSRSPDIDVWTIQMRGVEVLLEGKNPYTWATVPDTDPETDFTVPYVYPPTAIYAGVLGYLVGRDVRYALLGALLTTGLALRFIARRGRSDTAHRGPSLLDDAPALFFWLSPPLFFVLDRSWIDPVQIMLITLGVAAHVAGRRTLSAVVLGLAISSKQSMFWLIPLAAVLLRFDFRRWIVMGLAALAPVLPFLVWDFRSLKFANFEFMSHLPPRHDGLCFAAWAHHAFGLAFPTQLGFLLPAAAIALACLRRTPASDRRGHSPALSFARATLVAYFAFFFFNRWAFANYYFLLIGLSALIAATALQASSVRPDEAV